MDIYLKKDYMQYTGSFKERGARYTLMMLEPEQKKNGANVIVHGKGIGESRERALEIGQEKGLMYIN